MYQVRDEKGRFIKGSSGNPGGRPIGEAMAAVAGKFLTTTKKRKLIKTLYELGLAGNIDAIRLLWAYLDGKPTTRIEATGSVSFTTDPEWIRLRTVLVELADQVPEAREKLLKELGDDSSGLIDRD